MVSAVVLMRVTGWGAEGRVSFQKLHAVSWGSYSQRTCRALVAQLRGNPVAGGPFVSVDPALNLAIDFGVGEGLVRRLPNARLALSEAGVRVADEVIEVGLLANEVALARQLKSFATESKIRDCLRRRL